jgi:hypothetical protein
VSYVDCLLIHVLQQLSLNQHQRVSNQWMMLWEHLGYSSGLDPVVDEKMLKNDDVAVEAVLYDFDTLRLIREKKLPGWRPLLHLQAVMEVPLNMASALLQQRNFDRQELEEEVPGDDWCQPKIRSR